MNLPNKLTILRVFFVPLFMFFILFPFAPGVWSIVGNLLAAATFGLAALTDLADGKIARARGIVTDFGKFMDPLADKFMVFGAIFAFAAGDMFRGDVPFHTAIIISGTIVIFRELAVTSLRLVVAGGKEKIVIAASWYGKAKTVTQCVYVLVLLLEPILWNRNILSWICLVAMTVMTVLSGIDYAKKYWSYLDPQK